jgi:folylpolyglutamate synthase/dihydropteroate synthase
MSADKDVTGVAEELALIARCAVAVRANHPRAMAPQEVAAAFLEAGVDTEVGEEVAEALDKTMATADDKAVICLAGSLFVAAEGRSHLGGLR